MPVRHVLPKKQQEGGLRHGPIMLGEDNSFNIPITLCNSIKTIVLHHKSFEMLNADFDKDRINMVFVWKGFQEKHI